MNKKIVLLITMGMVCWGEVRASEGGAGRMRAESSCESEGEELNPKRRTVAGEGQEESGAASAVVQEGKCVVCYLPFDSMDDRIEEGEKLAGRHSLQCIHGNQFHRSCLECWIGGDASSENKKSCPLCRVAFKDEGRFVAPAERISIAPGVVFADREFFASLTMQQDGKFVVAGKAYDDMLLVRYNVNGTLDREFGTDGVVRGNFGVDRASGNSVIVQQDGKLVVTGEVGNEMLLVRYHSDGTLDREFGTNGVVQSNFGVDRASGKSMIVQQDGKLVVAGEAGAGMFLARYNSNGILDQTFGIRGVVRSFSGDYVLCRSLTMQQDGKLVVAGCYLDRSMLLVRYNNNGELDEAFGSGGVVQEAFGADSADGSSVIQQNGKLIVTGFIGGDMLLARYNENGILDTTFGTNENGFMQNIVNTIGRSVIVLQDGKLIITGMITEDFDFFLTRYNENGILDQTFGVDGVVRNGFGFDLAEGRSVIVQQDGKLVVAGEAGAGMFLARYNANGTPDITFGVPAQQQPQAAQAAQEGQEAEQAAGPAEAQAGQAQ